MKVRNGNAYGCYDANKETKSGKILRIFRYQVRAVTRVSGKENVAEDLCLGCGDGGRG